MKNVMRLEAVDWMVYCLYSHGLPSLLSLPFLCFPLGGRSNTEYHFFLDPQSPQLPSQGTVDITECDTWGPARRRRRRLQEQSTSEELYVHHTFQTDIVTCQDENGHQAFIFVYVFPFDSSLSSVPPDDDIMW